MCMEKDLIISDVVHLPANTYTHVNNGTLTRSWLDHCVTSASIHEAIERVTVDDNYNGSDHLPMTITLNMELPRFNVIANDSHEKN